MRRSRSRRASCDDGSLNLNDWPNAARHSRLRAAVVTIRRKAAQSLLDRHPAGRARPLTLVAALALTPSNDGHTEERSQELHCRPLVVPQGLLNRPTLCRGRHLAGSTAAASRSRSIPAFRPRDDLQVRSSRAQPCWRPGARPNYGVKRRGGRLTRPFEELADAIERDLDLKPVEALLVRR